MTNNTGIAASRRRSLASGLAAIFCLCLLGACFASPIKDDERVILFPTFAFEDNSSSWTGHIRGWIYEPATGSARNGLARALETLIAQRFSLSRERQRAAAASRSPFAQRADMFLVDNERGKRLSVTIAGQTVALGRTEENGHFEGEVKLPAAAGRPGDWIEVRALTGPGDTRVFAGRVQLIPRTGISVISDIDDTIKHSQVRDKVQLGLNTFFREQDPAVYAQLASEFPNVAAILIRDVTNEDLDSPRYAKLFSKLPASVERRVFRDTKELDDFKPR